MFIAQNGVIRQLRKIVRGQDGDAPTDRELVADFVARRDERAFEAIVRRHGTMVWGVCCRVLRRDHDAEDAFQATFVVLAKKAAALRDRDLVGNWLYGVAYRAALEVKAGRPKKERQLAELPEQAAGEAPVWSDLRAILDEELRRLPEKCRTAVVLCDLEGRTRREVARQLGIPEGTLSGRLTTARRTLAARLTRRGVTLSGAALAAGLSPGGAAARMPAALVFSTTKTAAAAVGSLEAAALSAQAAAAVEGVLKAMFLAKLRVAAALVGITAILALGGLWLFQPNAIAQPPRPNVAKVQPPKEPPNVIQAPPPQTYEVAGAKLEVALVFDQPTIMLGEPTYFRFRVANTSERDLRVMFGGDYRNRLGRPESFKIDVVRDDGRKVAQPDAGHRLGGLGGAAPLPGKGHYDFSLFLPHWATFTEPGRYIVTCRRKLQVAPDDGTQDIPLQTDDVETTAQGTITVVPADAKKFGDLIAQIGARMLDRRTDDYELAQRILAAIHDERVVPWFVRLAEEAHQSPRMTAAPPLGRYKSDEAFAALKKLMQTTAADVRGGSTTLELAESSAGSVRHYAIAALIDSPHPQALAFVWTQANDPYDGVRLTILHKAAEVKTADARALIETMTRDANERVRNEAIRYHDLLKK